MAQPAEDAAAPVTGVTVGPADRPGASRLPGAAAVSASGPAGAAVAGIGEVLTQLRSDFPDVTISKIRFLETEGLVSPARTRSGYRRFSGADVERLRWVLAVQRDRYLPLRVIKAHLDAAGPGRLPAPPPAPTGQTPPPAAPTGQVPPPAAPTGQAPPPPAAATGQAVPSGPVVSGPAVSGPAVSGPVVSGPVVSGPVVSGPVQSGPAAPVPATGLPRVARGRRLHRDEMLEATGLSPAALVEMEGFGLVRGRSGWYGPEDVAIGHTVARLAAYGIGPRHLRGLRSAADREIGLLEQVLAPQLRSRRPDARARAEESAAELRDLTRRLHDALVGGALRDMGVEPR